jgi:hypothetical protein
VSDHCHYEYAEARHDHRGQYADERHDHDLDYAEKRHRHYDLEREDERLKGLLDRWRADLSELREQLEGALGRIRQLEAQTPEARQAELEADLAAAGQDADDRCPDCGRASCTGEDCYWPDDAGITRPRPAGRDLVADARLLVRLIPAAAAQECTYCGAWPGASCTAGESAGYHVARFLGVPMSRAEVSAVTGAAEKTGNPSVAWIVRAIVPGSEVDDEGGMSEYRYVLPEDYGRGQS